MVKKLSLVLTLILLFSTLLAQAQSARDYYPTQHWRNAAPAAHGMDPTFAPRLTDTIRANLTYLHGLLVIRHGYIIYEDYFNLWNKDDLHSVRSVTKSITCALVGIALKHGDLPNIDVTLSDYFPEYFQERDNVYKKDITLRDLLTMRSGLGWDEGNRQNILNLARSTDDQMKYIISLGINAPHGQYYLYSTADVHLVSGMMTHATGMTLAQYAEKYLFAPLGIERYDWLTDSRGYNVGGTELSLTLADMAKFGYLYLNNGVWEDQQIIPPEWIALTTSAQPDVPRYGYLWWINQSNEFDAPGYYAMGYGGQYIVVFPELDMVIVTATDYEGFGDGGAHTNAVKVRQLINEIILPAVLE